MQDRYKKVVCPKGQKDQNCIPNLGYELQVSYVIKIGLEDLNVQDLFDSPVFITEKIGCLDFCAL